MRKLLVTTTVATIAFGAGLWAALPAPSSATPTQHVVELRNRGEGGLFVFEPMLLRIQPGDSVTFIPVDKGHNSQSIAGLVPAGAISWRGKISTPITVAFENEGVYGVRCAPHFTLGMVGLVVVGDPSPNLEQAAMVQLPSSAQSRMGKLLSDAQQASRAISD